MRKIYYPILGPANPSKAKEFGYREFENFYLMVDPYTMEETGSLCAYTRPGLKQWTDLTGDECRGAYVQDNIAYVCIDDKFYSVTESKTSTELGTLNSSTGVVYIAGTETNIIISDGTNVYNYNIADAAFTTAELPFSGGSPTMTTSDGYVIVHNGSRIYLSSLVNTQDTSEVPDYTTDPAFANIQGKPDDLVSITAFQRNLFLCGDISTEVWFNSGAADLPYSRISGVFINYGCAAKHSLASGDTAVFWLARGERGQLSILSVSESFIEETISSPALNSELLTYNKIDDAEGFVYQREGKEYYVLTFPTENVTWVYDATLKVWMKFSSGDNRWSARLHFGFNNKNLIGTYNSGIIYELDSDTFTDNGDAIRRKIVTAPIIAGHTVKHIAELELDIENGDAIQSGQGSNPVLQMRYSRDGGHTYTSTIYRNIGQVGQYLEQVKYNNINLSRKMVFELNYTEPTDFKIVSAWLTYQG